jgi:IS1 family transposase
MIVMSEDKKYPGLFFTDDGAGPDEIGMYAEGVAEQRDPGGRVVAERLFGLRFSVAKPELFIQSGGFAIPEASAQWLYDALGEWLRGSKPTWWSGGLGWTVANSSSAHTAEDALMAANGGQARGDVERTNLWQESEAWRLRAIELRMRLDETRRELAALLDAFSKGTQEREGTQELLTNRILELQGANRRLERDEREIREAMAKVANKLKCAHTAEAVTQAVDALMAANGAQAQGDVEPEAWRLRAMRRSAIKWPECGTCGWGPCACDRQ